MDAMSMSCSSLNTVASVPETDGSTLVASVHRLSLGGCALPAKTPHMTVDINGVLVVALIFDSTSKISPSVAIAYRMRGNGNIAPKRLYMQHTTTYYDEIGSTGAADAVTARTSCTTRISHRRRR